MDDLSLIANTDLFEANKTCDNVQNLTFSNGVFYNDNTDFFLPWCDEYSKRSQNQCLSTSPSSTPSTEFITQASDIRADNKAIFSDESLIEDEWDPDLNFFLNEEVVTSEDSPPDRNATPKQIYLENDTDPFAFIDGSISVKEQPKPDQRARYESDGVRFLPDARKHPMSIQLPDLSLEPLTSDETYGIIVTMVTSMENPQNKTFVHMNGLKYHTADAIEIGHGSIFVPLTGSDMEKCEKKLPRLSITRKKLDGYSFNLTSFDASTSERIIEKYTVENEDKIGTVAKGKQFNLDYNLCCYKIVCQLAVKAKHLIKLSHIHCETNIINEEKPTKGIKQRASSNDKPLKRRKNSSSHYSTQLSETIDVDKYFTSGDLCTLKRRANRSKRSLTNSS